MEKRKRENLCEGGVGVDREQEEKGNLKREKVKLGQGKKEEE